MTPDEMLADLRKRYAADPAVLALIGEVERLRAVLGVIANGRERPLEGGGYVGGEPVTETVDLAPGEAAHIAAQALEPKL